MKTTIILDNLLLYAVIHPIGVSGEKHVCPATFFNELHQCLTPRIARVHLDVGALRERGIDFVKRVLHGGSGKDGNTFFLARCEVSPEDCEKCENNRGEPDNPAHSVLPKRFTTRMSACSAAYPQMANDTELSVGGSAA